MKIAATIARYIMGLGFTVFGLNGFLNFLPAPPMTGLPAQFMAVMVGSHYMMPVFLIQLLCGILFLVNRKIPLALTFIAPVLFNIIDYHVTMNPSGIGPGIVMVICWFLVFARHRDAFNGIIYG